MTTQAEAWYRELYLSKITYKYNNGGFLLKQWVQPPAQMDGKTLYFPVASPGKASKTKRGDNLKPMNTGRSMVSLTADWYEAPEETFDIDVHKMSPSEQEAVTKAGSDALGQCHDAQIMAAFNAGAGTYTNPGGGTAVGSGTAAWDLAKAMTARNHLFRKAQNPRETAVCVLPTTSFAQMMTFTAFSNSQYVGDYPLVKGVQARTWMNVHWVEGYDNMFAQTPGSGSVVDATFYMWFPNVIGSGDTGGIKTNVFRDDRKRCWVHDNTIEIGAKVLLPEGIVECHADINSAIAVSGVV